MRYSVLICYRPYRQTPSILPPKPRPRRNETRLFQEFTNLDTQGDSSLATRMHRAMYVGPSVHSENSAATSPPIRYMIHRTMAPQHFRVFYIKNKQIEQCVLNRGYAVQGSITTAWYFCEWLYIIIINTHPKIQRNLL